VGAYGTSSHSLGSPVTTALAKRPPDTKWPPGTRLQPPAELLWYRAATSGTPVLCTTISRGPGHLIEPSGPSALGIVSAAADPARNFTRKRPSVPSKAVGRLVTRTWHVERTETENVERRWHKYTGGIPWRMYRYRRSSLGGRAYGGIVYRMERIIENRVQNLWKDTHITGWGGHRTLLTREPRALVERSPSFFAKVRTWNQVQTSMLVLKHE